MSYRLTSSAEALLSRIEDGIYLVLIDHRRREVQLHLASEDRDRGYPTHRNLINAMGIDPNFCSGCSVAVRSRSLRAFYRGSELNVRWDDLEIPPVLVEELIVLIGLNRADGYRRFP